MNDCQNSNYTPSWTDSIGLDVTLVTYGRHVCDSAFCCVAITKIEITPTLWHLITVVNLIGIVEDANVVGEITPTWFLELVSF